MSDNIKLRNINLQPTIKKLMVFYTDICLSLVSNTDIHHWWDDKKTNKQAINALVHFTLKTSKLRDAIRRVYNFIQKDSNIVKSDFDGGIIYSIYLWGEEVPTKKVIWSANNAGLDKSNCVKYFNKLVYLMRETRFNNNILPILNIFYGYYYESPYKLIKLGKSHGWNGQIYV